MQKLLMDICGPGGGSQTLQATTRPDHLWPEIWSGMSEAAQRKEKSINGLSKKKVDNARKLRGIYFVRMMESSRKP